MNYPFISHMVKHNYYCLFFLIILPFPRRLKVLLTFPSFHFISDVGVEEVCLGFISLISCHISEIKGIKFNVSFGYLIFFAGTGIEKQKQVVIWFEFLKCKNSNTVSFKYFFGLILIEAGEAQTGKRVERERIWHAWQAWVEPVAAAADW